jgi:pyruvate-formate lyase-activating enzyme
MSRLDHITSIPDAYRTPTPPAPISVKVELTGRCNYACQFCATRSKLRTKGDMEESEFVRLALELREAGVQELGLFYLGESFLVPWLPEAIRYAKHTAGFPYVFLTTNGSLATPERMKACMDAGLDSLKFSLNWANGDQFEDVARVKSTLFLQATDHIRQARRIRDQGGYSCKLYGSYIAYDDAQAERMRAYVEAIREGVDDVYELPLYTQAAHIQAEDAPSWRFSVGNQGRAECMRPPVPCWALFTEGHVTWDSKLAACCFDHDGKFEMGDLSTTPFMEAWHSDKFQELRKAHLDNDVKETVCAPCIIG